MYFFHGTTKQNAENIIETSLKESSFCLDEYLKYAVKEKAGRISKGYVDDDGKYNPVKWLGKGIYLFDTFNRAEAISWCTRYGNPKQPSSECTALSVKVKNVPDDNVFDFFSYSDIKELKSILEDKFMEYLEEREDFSADELLPYLYLQTSIVTSLDNLFQENPFFGGVAVDLYNLIQNGKIKLIRGIYKKGKSKHLYYDVYYCLKEEQFIESIENI
ncbi:MULTISPECIES: hypothetical protein [Bacillus]|uniref:DUF3990 domain-containing protein n=1 Tax=Bacillus anthracis TaxID=1392 RepID=A0A2A7DBM5_BACAN|nr:MULTISPECIES: hypothetical protein [Bacillus]PDZ17350.1 hypothetical protein CON16_10115 [Bacillus anthracis]PDZ52228.1 hypothetical protein CON07_06005 [Bacillus sp. AFS094611]